MSWLTKAQQALGYSSPTTPQPFEVTCSCGGVVRGVRREAFQQVWCARCGEPWFVLPADVYPPPKPPSPPKKKLAKAAPSKTRQRAASPSKARESRPPAGERLIRRVRTVKEDLRQKAKDVPGHAASGLRAAVARQKAQITPFRLVIVGILVVVAATGYWVMQRNAAERAEITLRTAAEAGYAALDAGDFVTASREFQRACDALAVLRRDDEKATKLRQMLRESIAASHLLSKPLFEVFNELPKVSHRDPAHWQDEFRRDYADQWLVLDTSIIRNGHRPTLGGEPAEEPSDSKSQSHERVIVDYPLVVGGKPAIIEMEGTLFDRLDQGPEPKRVVFAAQLEGGYLRKESPQSWVVTLRGETAFLWSNFDNYRAIGFEFSADRTEQQIRQILQDQSRLMGIDS